MSNIVLNLDIARSILECLSVKSILRLENASKEFNTLINDRYFIQFHHKRSCEDSSKLNFIVKMCDKLYLISYNSYHRLYEFKDINYPFKNRHDVQVLGNCQGLICLYFEGFKRMMLGNVSTRSKYFRIIPKEPIISSPTVRNYYGFGYDSINDIYKIVKIEQDALPVFGEPMTLLHIYDTKNNAWRAVEKFDYIMYGEQRNTDKFLHGALHWIVLEDLEWGSPKFILAFDVATEQHRRIQISNEIESDAGTDIDDLTILGGNLCLPTSSCRSNTYNIWIMKEYWVEDSWMLLCSLSLSSPLEGSIRPLFYSEKDEELLVGHQRYAPEYGVREKEVRSLSRYDLKKKELKMLDPFNLFPFSFVDCQMFTDSLVSTRSLGDEKYLVFI